MDLRHRFEYFTFRVFACALSMLSVRWTVAIAEMMAWLLTRVLPTQLTRYHVAADNIRGAFREELTDEQVEKLIFDMWVHLFRLLVETVQLPRKMTLTNCRRRTVCSRQCLHRHGSRRSPQVCWRQLVVPG